ncbi:complement resistance protein TraT [Gloeobacter morelensis]|uniref:Glycine zipper domain-containing protein n=1 Tax=Gloeobacter morelensis MG652769 TaxID=2781736 RepID=A0ABY3PN49_9CYAN|nr:complement resistance protein TraT [Gloeobacter morelensis]UFP95120.1 hypothetical protein ISF26_02380 [Gloeobacter morelensis MG652769]
MEDPSSIFGADWVNHDQEDSELPMIENNWHESNSEEWDDFDDNLQQQEVEIKSYTDTSIESVSEENVGQLTYENWIVQGYTVDLNAEFDPQTGNYATGLQPNSLGCDKTDYDGSLADNVKVGFSGITGAGGTAVGWTLFGEAGAAVLGGPAGAILGGIAGSVLGNTLYNAGIDEAKRSQAECRDKQSQDEE